MLSTVLGDVTRLSLTGAAGFGDSPSLACRRLDDLVSHPMHMDTTVGSTMHLPGVAARASTETGTDATKENEWRP